MGRNLSVSNPCVGRNWKEEKESERDGILWKKYYAS